MRIGVITLFPDMFSGLLELGVISRVIKQGKAEILFWNPRDFTHDKHRTVDDRPYGGGPGMLMKVQPLRDAIATARQTLPEAKVVYLSPQGNQIKHPLIQSAVAASELILVCGRYEGIDERLLLNDIDEEWSLGDFVLSGGEIAAQAVIDSALRLLPNALGNNASAEQDSFSEGLLDCPHYTRPEVLDEIEVPPVLLSGNHAEIAKWREKQSLGRTWQRRPDLFKALQLSDKQQQMLAEYRHETGLTDDAQD